MAVSSIEVESVGQPAERVQRRSDRRLYLVMSVACLAMVYAGFAQSFFQRRATLPSLTPLVTVHGVVFSSWFLLFFAQSALVATRHTRLHRRLGIVGAVLVALIVILGLVVALPATRRGALPGDPLEFLLVMLVDLFLFGGFAAAGIHYRRQSEKHKRLMLLATVSLLPPAISRLPIAVAHPPMIAVILVAFLAAAPAYDFMVKRRLIPLSLWGGLAVFVSIPLRFAIARTEVWHETARWLIR